MHFHSLVSESKFTVIITLLCCALLLSSCASLGSKSNTDLMEKTVGKQFVISVPKETLNIDLVKGEKRSDLSILRLVSEEDYQFAFQSNGNRLSGPLTIADPSSKILSSLNKYYQQQYQIKPIAKGTINNIDEAFLAKNLKSGDFLIDIRVADLTLNRDANNRFFPQGAFQFTVFDNNKDKNLIQDICRFTEPENAQTVSFFSNKNGQELTNFLNRYASACLNYFVSGKPLPTKQTPIASKRTATNQSSKATTANFSGSTLARVGLGIDAVYYPNYNTESRSFLGSQLSLTLGKPLSPTVTWVMQGQAKMIGSEQFPTFGQGTIYAASLGFGTQYSPIANQQQGYLFLFNGQIGQHRQNSVVLSTNSIGVSIGAFKTLLPNIQGIAQYTYWQHIGPTTEANKGGHGLGLGLGYLF